MTRTITTDLGRVDGRDVATWAERRAPLDPADADTLELARAYVQAHPRSAQGTTQGQRLALLRRLAARPARTEDLLAALRTVGWVGADDLANRLRELRRTEGARRGAGAAGIALTEHGDVVALAEPFPALDEGQERALGFAKAVTSQLDGTLATAATRSLDELLPDLPPQAHTGPPSPTDLASVERFHAALTEQHAVTVRYRSLNSRRTTDLTVVPIAYHTHWGAVKALCIELGPSGERGRDLQLALERIHEVTPRPGIALPSDLTLLEDQLGLVLSGDLLTIAQERDLFGLADASPEPLADDPDAFIVSGTFPRALAWDVMEQICAWAGSVQVREPLWLVNAVCRRLRAGLREMELGSGFELIKPEPGRGFPSHGEAVNWEPEERRGDGRARRLTPPARPT
ncbi:hypothetical protein ER308_05290 [Egibacter rhizosphaerae]|uniref:WYL domain-containing protein n=1 Tax=Egibacter rhizosphaerae TaxID=1670831 RepID=A0A411YCW5_9ACTN|nr:hypothetical protein [Egibacter rhizosphaerae]QBI19015.1 hypothetical protein ER308_05290 [Egibacter rhizosphaerae]